MSDNNQQEDKQEEHTILEDLVLNLTLSESLNTVDNKTKRLYREYENFNLNLENEDINNKLVSKVYLSDPNDITSDWRIIIKGPNQTPYQGGNWLLNFSFPEGYPFKAPKIKFLNKVYHCNISDEGIISMDILSINWAPLLTPYKVCQTIISFLNDSNPLSPLDQSKSLLYSSNRNQYDQNCREWVKLYASSFDDLIEKFNLNN